MPNEETAFASGIEKFFGRLVHECVPVNVQETLSPVIAPLSPFYLRRGGFYFYSSLRKLRRFQDYTREEIEEYQTKRLRETIKHCYENVPYYTRLFKREGLKVSDIRCIDDLEKIPILTKDANRSNFSSLISRRPADLRGYRIAKTSGSTGSPAMFVQERRLVGMIQAYIELAFENIGIPSLPIRCLRRERCVISDKVGMKSRGLFFHDDPGFDPIIRQIMFRNSVTEQGLSAYIGLLRKYSPRYFIGRPSLLYFLSRYVERERIKDVGFDIATTEGSPLSNAQRSHIEKHLGCRVFSFYRNMEHISFGDECSKKKGMHLSDVLSVTEGIRKGKVVFGKSADLVSTSLNHRAMPLIRYDMGDSGIMSKRKCRCGRETHMIESFLGRSGDILVLRGDRIIFPIEVQSSLEMMANIKESQLVQEDDNRFTIKVVTDEKFNKCDEGRLLAIMQRLLGTNTEINIRYVDSIFIRGEKPRIVISKLGKSH